MSGMRMELRGEVASQYLMAMVQAMKASTQIAELQMGNGVVSNSQDMPLHNLLSTTTITGNSSPHVKWTSKKGDTSILRVWRYATPEDKAALAILDQDISSKYPDIDPRRNDNDDDESPPRSSRDNCRNPTTPDPPEPKSEDDDVQEVVSEHRHNTSVSGLQLLGLHTATSSAPHVIEPKNPRQALRGPHSKE
ncbi:unnamed protein product [Closterium sp. NIES-53]